MSRTLREKFRLSAGITLLLLFCTGNVFPALYIENVSVDTIHVPGNISTSLSDSIDDFGELLFKRCGTHLQRDSERHGIILDLKEDDSLSSLSLPLQSQVFRIKTSPGTLIITAKEELGLRMGLYYILSEYGDCRWYFPGEIGEYIPNTVDWNIAQISQLVVPSYYSRKLSGLETDNERLWGIRNQLADTIPVSHNLEHIYSDVSFENHPEWLSFDGVSKEVPTKSTYKYWHPNLLAPGIAKYAADKAERYFKDNPDSLAFSIGINDSYAFDLSPTSIAAAAPLQYLRNRPVYSTPVFKFSDQVARVPVFVSAFSWNFFTHSVEREPFRMIFKRHI